MDYETRAALAAATSFLLNYLAITNDPAPADIIWGPGSNDILVAQKAAELFQQSLAPWVIFSGGNGHRWQDLTQTEAELFRDMAIDCGVPASRIITENKSTNTGENVAFSLEILDQMGLPIKSALLITIPPFQLRAAATVKKHRSAIQCINAPISWGVPSEWDDNKLLEASRLCEGEVRRLQNYPALGYIDFDPAKIPSEVIAAQAHIDKVLSIL